MRPLQPVSAGARVGLGIAFFVLFFAAWGIATLGGFVSKTFLADPLTMLRDGASLLVDHGFAHDIGMTIWRVVGGFLLAAIVAVPLVPPGLPILVAALVAALWGWFGQGRSDEGLEPDVDPAANADSVQARVEPRR